MSKAPTSIGFIMDGNRRWARERNLPTLEGHLQGFEKLREVLSWCRDVGIQEVTVYAFSTENWNRSREEVDYLMKLFESGFDSCFREVIEQGGRLRFIGERTRLSRSMQERINHAEKESAAGTEGTLVVALSYGGRLEILTAVNELLAEGKEKVTEEEFRDRMWSKGLRDPDLVIRTSGEKRLSNFLTWQSVYAELFFTETYWPAFSREEFNTLLQEYMTRERRLGT